jgi:hypothetical protein
MAVKKRPKTAADHLDDERPRGNGRQCYYCRCWKEEIRQLAEKKLKRPDLPGIAIWRAIRKAGADGGESNFRRHMVEHEADLWEKVLAQG